jgi:hypothetical protein
LGLAPCEGMCTIGRCLLDSGSPRSASTGCSCCTVMPYCCSHVDTCSCGRCHSALADTRNVAAVSRTCFARIKPDYNYGCMLFHLPPVCLVCMCCWAGMGLWGWVGGLSSMLRQRQLGCSGSSPVPVARQATMCCPNCQPARFAKARSCYCVLCT